MSRYNQSSRPAVAALTVLGCAALLIAGASPSATQSRIVRPQTPANSSNSLKKPRVATLRASDSPEGSRVALSSDQSLNDYEAYRRGDRFYVKIPAADVPRAEVVRGRAFGDVKVQRSADSTVVSFRLQPGATARVEQRGNKLDVVFKMPGAAPSTSNSGGREVGRNDAGPAPPPDSQRRSPSNSNTAAQANSSRNANRNANDRARAATAKPSPSPTPKAVASPTPKPSPTLQPSPAAKSSPVSAQQKSSPSGTPASGASQPVQGTTWNNFKERARYWILLAQLNPILVGIGAAVLLLLIGLFIFQLRRAKAARRSRPRKKPRPVMPVVVAPAPAAVSATQVVKPEVASATAVSAAPVMQAVSSRPAGTDEKPERTARVSDEVKKVMAGGDYNEQIIASDDRDTRQLVGAELLAALVGRNFQRRERAKAAFMKHGYFDDATRDLRIADSANERAAAARRLSFVHDREATPHLIGALDDPSADVRRAAVEALMDLKDPAAIAPLNSLSQTESDRKVPRTLIKQAIEACAGGGSEAGPATSAVEPSLSSASEASAQPAETEREVIEI